MSGVSALAVEGVRAGHGSTEVLHGVDLTARPGDLVAVLGGSGSGKTTLLRCIAGFHPVEAGEIRIDGRPVAGPGLDVPPERRRVGLVPQDGSLFGHLTVAANVGYGLDRAGRRSGRVEEMLDLVGLADLAGRLPAQLSGGQQQRVALARALAPAPALVLLDEPFTALDAGLRSEVRAQVRAALRAVGATAVLVTHDQQEALGEADVVAVLDGGRIAQAAAPRTVYGQPVDPAVGTLVGEAVVLPATVRAGRVETLLGVLPVLGTPIDGRGRVLVRPEQLQLSPTSPGSARVVDVVFHGHDTTVLVAVGGTTIRCRTTDGAAPEVGAAVEVRLDGPARYYPD